MHRVLLAVAALVLSVSAAAAAPLTPAQREALAGGWRSQACDASGEDGPGLSFTLEFAVSGGVMYVDDNYESSGSHKVTAADATGGTLRLTLDGQPWTFTWAKDGTLKSLKPTDDYSSMAGLTFRRCTRPADRGAIHLDARQTAGIAADMPGGPTLIDTRAKGGCKATEYQYLAFDLIGPLGYQLHRWNSMAYAEKIADGGKSSLKVDEIADFLIEKADAIPGGYRFTLTELIPPNGSRGDRTVVTVLIDNARHLATIPEWKRTYALCTNPK